MAKLSASGSSTHFLRQLGQASDRAPAQPFLFFRSDAGDEVFHAGLPGGVVVWPLGTIARMTLPPGAFVKLLGSMTFPVPDGRPGDACEFVFTKAGVAKYDEIRVGS